MRVSGQLHLGHSIQQEEPITVLSLPYSLAGPHSAIGRAPDS